MISKFSGDDPQHLKQICITVQQRGMVDDFVSATEKAEKLEGHPFKKLWSKLKGMVACSHCCCTINESDPVH